MLLINLLNNTKRENLTEASMDLISSLNDREKKFIKGLKEKGFSVRFDADFIYMKKTDVEYNTKRSDFNSPTKRIPI